ncbi:hypothetical protein A2T98_12375 [Nodularia spumigena CENA596]|uniref:Uncharacterized protein n=1 Tax=Nodularia spumigena CENA596 TaxID=1819295 RepID=A0A161XLI4_NODSP|nr:hypothetical protein [Nodularia spumigena]KZL49524.1 hypothetical protein A2T98_12375 [Nodularia spumigena CENA596]
MKSEHNFPSNQLVLSNSLPLTWERIVPNQTANDSASQKFLDLHFGRYKTASSYVTDKKVLDIACGSGYGIRILLILPKSIKS